MPGETFTPPYGKKLTVGKDNEFFIAIAKQKGHTFLMLGVINDEGNPQLLARVGKTNAIDPYVDCKSILGVREATVGTLAFLSDEGVERKMDHKVGISYQAYSINVEQLNEFLALIKYIEQKQHENSDIHQKLTTRQGIFGYLPDKSTDNKLHFTYRSLSYTTLDKEISAPDKTREEIAIGAQTIHRVNNCRTTALNILEGILGFATGVSKYFFTSLKHRTTLCAGQPDKDTFYILPPPPTAFTETKFSAGQMSVLKKLYKRLEEIPMKSPADPLTREKFNKIKAMYNEIAGKCTMSASELLLKIAAPDSSLFAKRAPNFFSQYFTSIPTSTTQKVFSEMKAELENLPEAEKTEKDTSAKKDGP